MVTWNFSCCVLEALTINVGKVPPQNYHVQVNGRHVYRTAQHVNTGVDSAIKTLKSIVNDTKLNEC